MREIKFIGNIKKDNDKRNYQYSMFECSYCGKHVERKRKDGFKAKFCSHQCYAKNREIRGGYKDSVIISGYRYVQAPGHPNRTKKGYVAEHRIVAECKIGRYLNKNEDIHHINFNKLDNSPDNLLVLSKSEHSKLHQSIKERKQNGQF